MVSVLRTTSNFDSLWNQLKNEGVITLDSLQQYNDFLKSDHSEMEDVISSLKIIDELLVIKYDSKEITKLLLSTFLVFKRMNDIPQNEDTDDDSILTFHLPSTIDIAGQKTYLKIKTLYLQANYTDPLLQLQIIDHFQYKSQFFQTLMKLKSTDIAFIITTIFLKLSHSIKTVHRLVFLIIAAQYSIITSAKDDALLEKVSKDAFKMLIKSDSLVYKFTATHLYALYTMILASDLSTNPIAKLVEEYKLKEKKFKLGIDWNTHSSSSNLLSNSLKSMKISENIINLIVSEDPAILLKSENFMTSLHLFIKRLDVNDTNIHKDLTQIILFVTDLIQQNAELMPIFDLLTFKLKDFTISGTNSTFLHANLELMVNSLSDKHFKKLGNFSKLFFHFGSELIRINTSCSIPFWRCFLVLESKVTESLLTLSRINFLCNSLIKKNNYEGLLAVISIYFDCVIPKNLTIFQYEEKMAPYTELIKLMGMAIFKYPLLADIVIRYIQNESLIIALMVSLIELINTNFSTVKTSIISSLIVMLKDKILDTGLFLFFLSRISMVIEFPINFKHSSIVFNEDSCVIAIENLVVSHLYILQTMTNTENSTDVLINSFKVIIKYLGTETSFTSYELEVIITLYECLTYNQLFKYANTLLVKYLANRKLEKQYFNKVFCRLLDSYIKLENLKKLETLMDRCIDNDEAMSYDEMNLRLSVLHYKIIKKHNDIIDHIEKIYAIFNSNSRFFIHNQSEKYAAIELLMLYAKFNKLIGIYTESDHVKSVSNLTKYSSILQSIFKNFLLPGPKAPSLNLNFKSVLKMKFSYEMLDCYTLLINKFMSIGLGKEIEYYLNELKTFLKLQPSINLQYTFNLQLLEYSLFKNATDDAKTLFENVKAAEKMIVYDGNFLITVKSLMIFENYFRKIGDAENVVQIASKLDAIMWQILDSDDCSDNQYFDIIEKWTNILRARIEYMTNYSFNFDEKNVTTNKDVNNIVSIISNYNRSLKQLESNGGSGSVLMYPCLEASQRINTGLIENSKLLNLQLINDLKDNFATVSIQVFKSKKDLIINYLIKMINYDKSVKMDYELNEMLSITDEFKYMPFKIEKNFAFNHQNQKVYLPELPKSVKAIPQINSHSLKVKDVLPNEWIVVTIDYNDVTNSLVMTRYDNRYEKPIFIDIPLSNKDKTHSFESVLKQFEEVTIKSDETTSIEITSNIQTFEQKCEWWETRRSLDSKLESLLEVIDSKWFGGFSSLFQFNEINPDIIKSFKNDLIDLVKTKASSDSKIVEFCLNSFNDVIYELFLKIDRISVEKIQDLLGFVLEALILDGIIDKYDVLEVANSLRKKISNYVLNNQVFKDESKSHIVLVTSAECTKFPWESIPSLRKKSVSRMPTIHQLKDYLVKYKHLLSNGIDATKGYYVINPGGDLKQTQQNLTPRFRSIDGWDGVVGTAPRNDEILEAFDNKNLYIYAGHGGGQQYVKSKQIKQRSYIPPTLLLGCSSGKLKGSGLIHPYGTAYNYINGGCPMLLVNLWDVTDKDIDMFTVETLTKWGIFTDDEDPMHLFELSPENLALTHCVSKSRDVCKLKYLNGAAPVVYGLPLRLESL